MPITDATAVHRPSVGRRHAFSLVELVAVASAVAILIGLATPSLSAARGKSRQAVCLDRLGSISRASRAYAVDDPHGWFIPVHPLQYYQHPSDPTYIGAYEWGGKSGIGAQGYLPGGGGADAWITSKFGTKIGFGPATRPLNRVLYPHGFRDNLNPEFDRQGAFADTRFELPAYRCPADDRPPAAAHCPDWVANPGRSSYDHFGNSFAANVFMTAASPGQMFSNSPYLRPLSRVPNPVRTIGYEENIGRWAWACRREIDDCTWLGSGVDPGPSKQLDGWHGKPWTYNRAFVDGHAATQAVYIEDTEDADGYANHYYNEIVYEDADIQSMFRCIIVRGDGWQKDTLPASRIPTGIGAGGDGRASYERCVTTE